jgi:hypothetical protein
MMLLLVRRVFSLASPAAPAAFATLAAGLRCLFAIVLEIAATHLAAFASYLTPLLLIHGGKAARRREFSASFRVHPSLPFLIIATLLTVPAPPARALLSSLLSRRGGPFAIVLEVPAAQSATLAACL